MTAQEAKHLVFEHLWDSLDEDIKSNIIGAVNEHKLYTIIPMTLIEEQYRSGELNILKQLGYQIITPKDCMVLQFAGKADEYIKYMEGVDQSIMYLIIKWE